MKEQIYTPNGWASWKNTHHEIVRAIAIGDHTCKSSIVKEYPEMQGENGLYEFAEKLTNEFENLHKGRDWGGEFFDEIEKFIEEKLYP